MSDATQELIDSMREVLDQIGTVARQGQKLLMDTGGIQATDATVQSLAGFIGVTLNVVTKLAQSVIQMTQHNIESFGDLDRKIDELGVALGGAVD